MRYFTDSGPVPLCFCLLAASAVLVLGAALLGEEVLGPPPAAADPAADPTPQVEIRYLPTPIEDRAPEVFQVEGPNGELLMISARHVVSFELAPIPNGFLVIIETSQRTHRLPYHAPPEHLDRLREQLRVDLAGLFAVPVPIVGALPEID